MKVTEVTRNSAVVFNLTLCKSCRKKLVNTLQFVRLKSLYTVLGVSPTASQKEIRDAYIKLSKENHPDQNRDDKKSHEKFVLIKEAYETLSKDISRRDYDMKLRKPSAYPRSTNYYSSGDFYQDQQHHGPFSHGPYGSETSGGYHYNPYSTNRAHQQQAHDPFSEYNYEYYQRQREKEEAERMFDDDHRTFLVFKNRIMVIYSWLFLMPLFGMIFLAVNESAEDEWIRQQKAYTYYYAGGKYPSDAYIKRLALFYVYGYVIGPFLVIAMIFRQAFKEYYYEAGEDKSSTMNLIKIGVTILLIPMLLLRGFAIYITLFNDKNSEENKRYSSPKAAVDLGLRRLQITVALLLIPFLMIRWLFWYMTLFQDGSPPKPPPKPDTKPESREHLKIVLWRFLRRYWIILLLAYFVSEMFFNILLSGPDGLSLSTESEWQKTKDGIKDHDNRAWKVFMYFAKYKFYSYIVALVVILVVQYEIRQKDLFHLTKAKEEKEEKSKSWHGTKTEPKPKPKGADDYRMINFFKGIMFGMIFLMGASVAYEIFISVQIQMLEAEAWESGRASKSKMLFYLALYSAIVYILSKREVERRKLKKQQDEHMALSKPHSQQVEESS